MTILFPDFKEFLRLLNTHSVRYVLLGGYAVNFYGYRRTTGDLDVWISTDAVNAEQVSKALIAFGFKPSSVPASIFTEQGKLFRFGVAPVRIELLTLPSGVEFEACYAARTQATLDGVDVSIISLHDLRQKKLPARDPRTYSTSLNCLMHEACCG